MSEAALDNSGDDSDAGGSTNEEVKGTGTVVDGDNEGGKEIIAPVDWPTDWRDKLAGKDEKLKARLERMASPVKVLEAWRAAEVKISQGVKPAAFDPKSTPEEQAAWRAANDVPEAPEKYDTNIGDGVVWGEEDKPIVDSFLKSAHEANMPNSYAKAALGWYHTFQEQQAEAQATIDEDQRRENSVALQSEWGAEFKTNINAIQGWFDSIDPGDKEEGRPSLGSIVFGARGIDGGKLGNNPVFLRALVEAARAINPAATVIPGNADSSGKSISDELAEIDKFRREHRKQYTKDEKMQARERQLLEAQLKLAERKSA